MTKWMERVGAALWKEGSGAECWKPLSTLEGVGIVEVVALGTAVEKFGDKSAGIAESVDIVF